MNLHSVLREIVRVELKLLAREIIREEIGDKVVQSPEVENRSTYKGDSQTKKSVRLRVWELVQKTLGQKAFIRGPHVFLASHEGGDASTLRGLGVPDSAMIAVDMEQTAVHLFREKFPGVMAHPRDVQLVLKELEQRPTSVFLDFSSQVSENTLERVKAALHVIKPGGILACTFAVGREKNWQETQSQSKYRAYEERLGIVEGCVAHELGYAPRVLRRLKYISESAKGPGSSIMCVIVFQIVRKRDAAESKLQEIGMHDMYRDAFRHRKNRQLRWLFNYDEDRAESLRQRVTDYPPPRVT